MQLSPSYHQPSSPASSTAHKLTTALARVRAFLPLMAQANADLAARAATEGADSVVIDGQIARDAGEEKTNPEVATARGDADCESAGEGKEDKEEIEMDVGVGVFDVQGDIGGADVGPVVERDAAVWEGKVGEVKGQGKGEVEAKGAEA